MKKKLYWVDYNKNKYDISSSHFRLKTLGELKWLLINLIEDLVCGFDKIDKDSIDFIENEIETYLKFDCKLDEEKKELFKKIFELVKPCLLIENKNIEVVENVGSKG